MAIADKINTAKRISELLNSIIKLGDIRLKYKITVDPPLPEERDWERPVILVELSGKDTSLLMERNAELLRAIEYLVLESLRVGSEDHEKVAFDALGYRAARFQELRMAATVAAEKVRRTGAPYSFTPMSSRERRIVHLALRDADDLRTESQGEGPQRHLVVYPKNYKGKPLPSLPMRRGRR